MQALVSNMVTALVDHPDAVEITETVREDGKSITIGVKVHSDDMGKVIGKQGRIAKAIRTVVKAAATREDMHVSVDIIQD